MNASFNLVSGVFFGAEIEPGNFHHFNPDCLLPRPTDTRPADEGPDPLGGTDESPVAAPLNADDAGVTSKPIGDGEDAHLAGKSPVFSM